MGRTAYALIVLFSFSLFTCRDNFTNTGGNDLQLDAEYVGVTETSLRCSFLPDNYQTNGTLTLALHDSVTITIPNAPADTIFLIKNLLPNTHYTFKARIQISLLPIEYSKPIGILTLDTSTHDISWMIDTLGDGNGSEFFDVAIINDTLAYAVGEVNKLDSTGLDFETDAYNAAKWNGTSWELLRIPFVSPCNALVYTPLKTVWAYSPSSILLSNGGSIANFDGKNAIVDCRMHSLLTGAINKIWSSDSSNIYAVGNAGNLIRFSEGEWRKISTGTSLDIKDIWGVSTKSNSWEITAVAGNYLQSRDRAILQIANSDVVALSSLGIDWALYSIWFSVPKQYWVAGDGVWRKSFSITSGQWEQVAASEFVTNKIRGAEVNDVFGCGAFGDCFHYNGITWGHYMSQIGLENGQYNSIAVKGKRVIAVGYDASRAVIAVGTRTTNLNSRKR